RGQPLILVMPFGSTGTFTDKEWANAIRANEGWETFVAHDLVRAIDSRYRTIATGAGRALGGLSEGGYGALNIGLHHPGEFKVLEGWSGYETAFPLPAIFDRSPALLADNSPMKSVIRVAPELRGDRTFIWFYSGSDDHLLGQNQEFASLLSFLGIRHQFFVPLGRHSW